MTQLQALQAEITALRAKLEAKEKDNANLRKQLSKVDQQVSSAKADTREAKMAMARLSVDIYCTSVFNELRLGHLKATKPALKGTMASWRAKVCSTVLLLRGALDFSFTIRAARLSRATAPAGARSVNAR